MFEFFAEYGLFLAKSLTLFLGIIITAAIVIALAAKQRTSEGEFSVSDVSKSLDETKHNVAKATLSKGERKQYEKGLKQDAKAAKKKDKEETRKPRLFVLNFDGDIKASQVDELRENITAILLIAEKNDEVLVVLESGGGFVPHYGLAASQLRRLRDNDLHLTVAIDKIAASGGYLMAAVGNQLIAAPFAILGSIGVLAQLPNFHRLLEKHDVDFEQITAGKYKRTITMFGENTDKAREKTQQDIDDTHELFKMFVQDNRPNMDIEKIATGETWHATKAYELQLIDKIQTSDDFILEKNKDFNIFEINYMAKHNLKEKITSNLFSAAENALLKIFSNVRAILT